MLIHPILDFIYLSKKRFSHSITYKSVRFFKLPKDPGSVPVKLFAERRLQSSKGIKLKCFIYFFGPQLRVFKFTDVNLQSIQSAQISKVRLQRPSKHIIFQVTTTDNNIYIYIYISWGLWKRNKDLGFKAYWSLLLNNLQLHKSSYVTDFLGDCSADPVTQERTGVDHLVNGKFVKGFHISINSQLPWKRDQVVTSYSLTSGIWLKSVGIVPLR